MNLSTKVKILAGLQCPNVLLIYLIMKYWGPMKEWEQPKDTTDEEWHDITHYTFTASTQPMAIEIDS